MGWYRQSAEGRKKLSARVLNGGIESPIFSWQLHLCVSHGLPAFFRSGYPTLMKGMGMTVKEEGEPLNPVAFGHSINPKGRKVSTRDKTHGRPYPRNQLNQLPPSLGDVVCLFLILISELPGKNISEI